MQQHFCVVRYYSSDVETEEKDNYYLLRGSDYIDRIQLTYGQIISISRNLFEGAKATNDQNRSENNFKHLEHSTDPDGLFLKN